ncbi:MAG: Epoxyqueuosine reductase [Candidatus Methanolliviera sp. GoM_asphalt]|nr:MAG: Epoxyqueuosine reductase [Candidatus Methanolliviera sp. GoM_asphalt]
MEEDIELTKEIKEKGIEFGAAKIGIGEADRCDKTPFFFTSPYTILKDAKSMISICVNYPEGILDVPSDDPFVFLTTFGSFRVKLQDKLRDIASSLVGFIDERGYKAVPIDPVIPIDERRWFACLISHKYAGMMSGLGDIGMNNALLTPEFGPRIELATIFTNVPLKTDALFGGSIYEGVCKECKKCADICPTQGIDAFKKPPYNIDLNRCLWGTQGWMLLSKIEIPPDDWVSARPTVNTIIPKYKGRYPKIKEYQAWQEEYGGLPYCMKCIIECPYGKKE